MHMLKHTSAMISRNQPGMPTWFKSFYDASKTIKAFVI